MTHLAIALANYIDGWLHAQTALVEFGDRDTLGRLSSAGDRESFAINGVDYFPAASTRDIGVIFNMGYEYIIIDLGRDSRSAREELLRCNGKLIVGSLCPWRRASYYEFIGRIQKNMGELDLYTFLALFEDKIEIKRCRRTFKVQAKSIPFIADPFCIKEQETPFLHSLI